MKEVNLGTEIDLLTQITVEDLYGSHNIQQEIRMDILNGMDDISKVYKKCIKAVKKYMKGDYYKSKNKRLAWIQFIEPEDIVIELFMHVMPNPDPVSIQKIVGSFAIWFQYDDILDGVRTAAEVLGACRKCKLYRLIEGKTSEDGYINIHSRWLLDDKTLDYIEKTRYMNPMITVPNTWHTNKGGGYITTRNSVILGGKLKHHNQKQALNAVNILQKIKWSLDPRILKLGEKSKEPLDTPEKEEAFERFTRISKKVYKEMLKLSNVFFFTWRMDFRGRMYCDGYYINLQSNSFHKAMLEFTEKRLITDEI